MDVDIIAPAMAELVDERASLELLADGFHFLEGPVWHEDGYLLFTDVGNDEIWRWDERDGARLWRTPTDLANGMTRDPQGRLLSCEQSTSRLTRYEADGSVTVVASHFEGKELNSPNDVVCRSDGIIYFTDPPAGRSEPHGRPRDTPPELDFSGLFLLRPGATGPELQDDTMTLPNGLCFSPDESVLYVNDTMVKRINAYDVAADGSLSGKRLFFQQPGPLPDGAAVLAELLATGRIESVRLPDGMRADAQGNVYTGGATGVMVVDPGGGHIGTIGTPEFVGNLAWGDANFRSLFLGCTSGLYRLGMSVAGAPPAHPR
jgi:gluconolactonase